MMLADFNSEIYWDDWKLSFSSRAKCYHYLRAPHEDDVAGERTSIFQVDSLKEGESENTLDLLADCEHTTVR